MADAKNIGRLYVENDRKQFYQQVECPDADSHKTLLDNIDVRFRERIGSGG